jgi:NADPH:quinone reductase-like Zn-dependent oxidoreductase
VKAWLWERYGPPEALRLADVEKPTAKPGEVLLKVEAASVNAADWHSMRGRPLFSRLTLGLLRPKHRSLGVDVAGRIEAVGNGVTMPEPGSEVYANLVEHGYGGFAEYVSVPVGAVAPKPVSLSSMEAAAVPMAGVTALQGLKHHGELLPGEKVLINGGSGGVGTFAVQIAHSFGVDLTVVTSAATVDLVRSLGADEVLDYTTTDFAHGDRRYDRILDTVGNRSVADLRRALTNEGKAAVTGFSSLSNLLSTTLRGGQDVSQVTAHVATSDLQDLGAMADAGNLRPVIDRTYGFGEVPEALAYVEEGHARGKVIVQMD